MGSMAMPSYEELLGGVDQPASRPKGLSSEEEERRHEARWPVLCPEHMAPVADFHLPPGTREDIWGRPRPRSVDVIWKCGCQQEFPVCPRWCPSCSKKIRRWIGALPD